MKQIMEGTIVFFSFYNRCHSTFAQRRTTYSKYILPYLRKDVTASCMGADEGTLVVHLRDGDTASICRGNKAQPPCSYYDTIISTGYDGGPFSKVELVHYGAPENPCVQHLLGKHSNKIIQRQEGSLQMDTCAIIKATNLAVSFSSFSATFKMMNTHVKRLYLPALSEKPRLFLNYDENITDVCLTLPGAVRYSTAYKPSKGDCDRYFYEYPSMQLISDNCTPREGAN